MDSLTVASTPTTQRAPLERLLAHLRARRILPHIKNRSVLDFGCGADLWTSRTITPYTHKTVAFDVLFSGKKPRQTPEGIHVVGSLEHVAAYRVDLVMALACFEHIEPMDLPPLLRKLSEITVPRAEIIGTMPTPMGKPVLEFLSYKLHLIDSSQIRDHRIYYSKQKFAETVKQGGWVVCSHNFFQFGMNGFFHLKKCNA